MSTTARMPVPSKVTRSDVLSAAAKTVSPRTASTPPRRRSRSRTGPGTRAAATQGARRALRNAASPTMRHTSTVWVAAPASSVGPIWRTKLRNALPAANARITRPLKSRHAGTTVRSIPLRRRRLLLRSLSRCARASWMAMAPLDDRRSGGMGRRHTIWFQDRTRLGFPLRLRGSQGAAASARRGGQNNGWSFSYT